jgi:hypothetical protein
MVTTLTQLAPQETPFIRGLRFITHNKNPNTSTHRKGVLRMTMVLVCTSDVFGVCSCISVQLVPGELDLAREDFLVDAEGVFVEEGREACQHFVHQDAQRPPVHALAVPFALPSATVGGGRGKTTKRSQPKG